VRDHARGARHAERERAADGDAKASVTSRVIVIARAQ
jgi:hypothetical protein